LSAMDQRLLVISPVHNEAEHLERVALAMAAQTRPPDRWVVVDDFSTDDTRAVLERLAPQLPFMRVIGASARVADGIRDRLATASEAVAFNHGLRSEEWESFTHIAKLDGDTELPPRYFERLLEEFARNPRLGMAGGVRVERVGGRETVERVPVDYHVPGALKCYTTECLLAIGGMQERLTWDTIDEVYARMRGFQTRTFPELVAVHHRPWASADGILRGRARHGRSVYMLHYPFPWVLFRALKTAGMRPWGLSGVAYLGGYLVAAARSTPRVPDPEFRTFFRRELRGRVRAAAARTASGWRGALPPATRSALAERPR
jgi:biofilm PGA synthesis N-glycosyltransferase PgaC